MSRKIEGELGFIAAESMESGLAKTITWYLEHEAWWRTVMDGTYREGIRRQYPAGAQP